MPSTNLDLVRSIYAAWERGDFGSAVWAHSDIEYVRVDGPAPGSWRGFDDIARGMREMMSAWHEFRVTADEYRELDDQRVLVLGHITGRGKRSGLEARALGGTAAQVFHIGDGKVTRIVNYYDRERALADLGLAPESGTADS
jgi:ketosteroid isomerase-like protein